MRQERVEVVDVPVAGATKVFDDRGKEVLAIIRRSLPSVADYGTAIVEHPLMRIRGYEIAFHLVS